MLQEYDIENNLNQPYIPINGEETTSPPSITYLIVRHYFLQVMIHLSLLFGLYCIVLDIKYGSQDEYTVSKTTDIIIWYTIYVFIFNIAMTLEFQSKNGIYGHFLNIIFAGIIILDYFRYYDGCKITDDNYKTVPCSSLLPLQLYVHVYMAIITVIAHMTGIIIWLFAQFMYIFIA